MTVSNSITNQKPFPSTIANSEIPDPKSVDTQLVCLLKTTPKWRAIWNNFSPKTRQIVMSPYYNWLKKHPQVLTNNKNPLAHLKELLIPMTYDYIPSCPDNESVNLYKHCVKNSQAYIRTHVPLMMTQAPIATLSLFLDLSQRLPKDSAPALQLFLGARARLPFPQQNFKLLSPFFNWFSKKLSHVKKHTTEEHALTNLLDKVAALYLVRPELFLQLTAVPENKCGLWHQILKSTEYLKTLREEDIKYSFHKNQLNYAQSSIKDQKDEPLITHCESFFNKHQDLKKPFLIWIDKILEASNQKEQKEQKEFISNLESKLEKTENHYKNIIKKIATSNAPHVCLKEVLLFAQEHFFSSTVDKYLETIIYLNSTLDQYDLINSMTAFRGSVKNHPHLMPNFLQLLHHHPLLLPSLYQLQCYWKPDRFEHFLLSFSTHIFDPYKKMKLRWLDDAQTRSNFEKLLKDSDLLNKLEELIRLEMERNILLALPFLSALKLLESPLFDTLKENVDFSRQFYQYILKHGSNIQSLNQRLQESSKDFLTMFKMMWEFPKTAYIFSDQSYIWDSVKSKSPFTQEYAKFLYLYNDEKKHDMLNRLLRLIEIQQTTLFNSLLHLIDQDEKLLSGLLDMTQAGALTEVAHLIHLKNEKPEEIRTIKLLALASSKNISLIHAVLKLQQEESDNPFLKLFDKYESNEFIFNLLTLLLRKEMTLFNWALTHAQKINRSSLENKVIMLITEGQFALAQEFLENSNNKLWIDLQFIQSNSLCHRIRDLRISIDPTLTNGIIKDLFGKHVDTIIRFVLSVTEGFGHVAEEWLSNLQFFMQHEPLQLHAIITSKEWRAIDEQLKKGEDPLNLLSEKIITEFPLSSLSVLPNHLCSILPKEKGKKLSEVEALTTRQNTQLSIGLAQCLLTPGGTINATLIDSVIEVLNNQEIFNNIHIKNHFTRILNILKDHDISHRLEKIHTPNQKSLASSLIRHLLKQKSGEKISARDARVIALSSLIYYFRQSSAGSCFATAPLYQLDSTIDGLKQSLEDYIELLMTDRLTRQADVMDSKILEYPMLFNSSTFIAYYTDDHLLVRAREEVVASMSGTYSNTLLSEAVKKWNELLSPLLNLFIFQHSLESIESEIKNSLSRHFIDSCRTYYASHLRHPEKAASGAWLLIDKQTGKQLGKSSTVLRSFFERVSVKALSELVEKHSKYTKEFKVFFDTALKSHISSDEFLEQFLHVEYQNVQEGLPRINPLKYGHLFSKSPLVSYGEGGHTSSTISSYFARKEHISSFLRAAGNPLECLAHYFQRLSEDQKHAARLNPHLLITVETQNHSFNIKAGYLIQKIDQLGLKAITDRLLKETNELLSTPLTGEISDAVTNPFLLTLFPQSVEPFKYLLKSKFNPQIHTTVIQLARLIINTFCEISEKPSTRVHAENSINKILLNAQPLWDKRPYFYKIADTNWKDDPMLLYGLSLNQRLFQTTVMDSQGQVSKNTWNAGGLQDWLVHSSWTSRDRFSNCYYT